jgi:hypothetical protein
MAKKNADSQLITEIKVFDNDTTFRYTYFYNNEGNMVLQTNYYKHYNSWIRRSQIEWMYDAGKCTSQIERMWGNNGWENLFAIDYSYFSGLLMSELSSKFVGNIKQPVENVTFEYAGSALISRKTYNYQSNTWLLVLQNNYIRSTSGTVDTVFITALKHGNVTNKIQCVNTYNASGKLISHVQMLTDSTNKWINNLQNRWFYAPNSGLIISQQVKSWNAENSRWENQQRTDFEYDSSNKLKAEIYQYWKSMCWQSDLRYKYVYDTNGNEIKKIVSKPIYNEWRDLISINYSNFNGNKANSMESKYEFWGGTTGELVSSYIPFDFNNEIAIQKAKSLQISYTAVTDTLESVFNINSLISLIKVYPNPSDGIYYLNSHDNNIQSWEVANIDGKVLRNNFQAVKSGVIDLTELPKGVYVLRAMTPTGYWTQKLIKY